MARTPLTEITPETTIRDFREYYNQDIAELLRRINLLNARITALESMRNSRLDEFEQRINQVEAKYQNQIGKIRTDLEKMYNDKLIELEKKFVKKTNSNN